MYGGGSTPPSLELPINPRVQKYQICPTHARVEQMGAAMPFDDRKSRPAMKRGEYSASFSCVACQRL